MDGREKKRVDANHAIKHGHSYFSLVHGQVLQESSIDTILFITCQ